MAAFYPWSPNHTDDLSCSRSRPYNWMALRVGQGPMNVVQCQWPEQVWWPPPQGWLPPPLKEHWASAAPLFPDNGRPTLVVSNKYELERFDEPMDSGKPTLGLNHIRHDALLKLLLKAATVFNVVYNHPWGGKALGMAEDTDGEAAVQAFDLRAVAEAQRHPQGMHVHTVHQLIERYGGTITYNEALARLMARSGCIISVQGGTSYFSAYFANRQIVLHRNGPELPRTTEGNGYNAYRCVLSMFRGANIIAVATEEELLSEIDQIVDRPELCH